MARQAGEPRGLEGISASMWLVCQSPLGNALRRTCCLKPLHHGALFLSISEDKCSVLFVSLFPTVKQTVFQGPQEPSLMQATTWCGHRSASVCSLTDLTQIALVLRNMIKDEFLIFSSTFIVLLLTRKHWIFLMPLYVMCVPSTEEAAHPNFRSTN